MAIHTDCVSALQLVRSQNPNNLCALNESIRHHVASLRDRNIQVEIAWIAGHADVSPNELADKAAKEAAQAASMWTGAQPPVTLQDAKCAIRNATIHAWKRQWDLQPEGRHTHSILPIPSTKPLKPDPSRRIDVMLSRLRSGHTLLAEHSHRMKVTDSPNCQCGQDRGTITHFLFHCPLDHDARENMVRSIELGYIRTNTPAYLRIIDGKTLLGANTHLYSSMRDIIDTAVRGFLASTVHRI